MFSAPGVEPPRPRECTLLSAGDLRLATGDLADGLSALPARRKAIVFISEGVDLGLAGVMIGSTRAVSARLPPAG